MLISLIEQLFCLWIGNPFDKFHRASIWQRTLDMFDLWFAEVLH
jgi:hypothetical protein